MTPTAQLAIPDEMVAITILFFYTDGFADDFDRFANSRINARFEIVGIEKLRGMPARQFPAMEFVETNPRAKRRRDELAADLRVRWSTIGPAT